LEHSVYMIKLETTQHGQVLPEEHYDIELTHYVSLCEHYLK